MSKKRRSVSLSRNRAGRELLRSGTIAVLLAIPTAVVAGFSFTSDMADTGFADNSRAQFTFSTAGSSDVTLRTWSYAGGTNQAGTVIPRGGFDPIISVFDSQGQRLADNDDGSGIVDPDTGYSYDALINVQLDEGEYAAVLTQFSNFSEGSIDEFEGSDGTAIQDGRRSSFWALDILGADSATFLGILNGSTGEQPSLPPPPTQEQLDSAMQDIAANENTRSTASVISTACPQAAIGSRFREDCTPIVLGALSPEDSANAQAGAALAAVTTEQATVPLSSSRASLSSQTQNLSTRLSALRAGATGFSVGGIAFETEGFDAFSDDMAAVGLPVPTGGAASADSGSILVGEKLGVFINGTVTSADKDATRNEEGYDVSGWAITAGADYRFLDNAIAGVAVGYYNSSTEIDANGGDLDTDGYSLSLYGTYYHDERLYVDGILTYGSNDYDQSREIRYQVGPTKVSQDAKASYDGDQWSAAISGGYNMSTGPWTYGPVVRLEYVSASVDGYSERMSNPSANGGAWAARLGDLDQESLTSALGGTVSRAFGTDWGVVLPQLHVSWVHEYRDDAVSVNGVFLEDPTSTAFSVTGDSPDTDYFNARLGVSAQFAKGTSAFLYYNKVFGYRDLDVDTFGAGVRLTF